MERVERIKNMDTWELSPDIFKHLDSTTNTVIGFLQIMNATLKFYAKLNGNDMLILIEIQLKKDTGKTCVMDSIKVVVGQPFNEENVKEKISKELSHYIKSHYYLRKEYNQYRDICQQKALSSVKSIILYRGFTSLHIYKATDMGDDELRRIFSQMKTSDDYYEFYQSLPERDLPMLPNSDDRNQTLAVYEKLIPGCNIYGCTYNYCGDRDYIIKFYKCGYQYNSCKIHPLADTVDIKIRFYGGDACIPLDISKGKTYTSAEIEQKIEERVIDESDYESNMSELYAMGIIRDDEKVTAVRVSDFEKNLKAAIRNTGELSPKDRSILTCIEKAYQAPASEKVYWLNSILNEISENFSQ